MLRWPGVCIVPTGWDDDWGIGRVDLLNLLHAPLPAPGDLDVRLCDVDHGAHWYRTRGSSQPYSRSTSKLASTITTAKSMFSP